MTANSDFPDGIMTAGGMFALRSPAANMPSRLTKHFSTNRFTTAAGWLVVVFKSSAKLLDEEPPRETYSYSFLVREVQDRYLIVGPKHDLVEKMLTRIGQREHVRPPAVAVQGIAEKLLREPGDFALSGLWAKVHGHARSVRNVVYYGDDLRKAPMITENLRFLEATRVQLRDRGLRRDVLSISSRGEVGFFYRDESTLIEIDHSLAALRRDGFLTWDSGEANHRSDRRE